MLQELQAKAAVEIPLVAMACDYSENVCSGVPAGIIS